jgi:hypothetical protein
MRAARRSITVLVLVAAIFASLAALSRLRAALPPAPSIEVQATRIQLPPGDPARGRLGALLFRGGLVLESGDPRFGGLSDLRLSPDGRRMVAVSDCGYGFSAELVHDEAGGLAGIEAPRLVELTGPGGRALRIGENDAESLVADGSGLEVGFEGRGRVWRYTADPPFSPPVEPVPTPPGLALCGSNMGIETMARLDATRRLLICEGERTPSLTVPAWIGVPGGAWTERRYPLHFEGGWAGEPFRPTSATRLDDGDVLVLERRFPPFGSRVVRVPRASVEATGGPLAPVEIASLEGSALVDNYEGIEARRDEAGRTLVYLISDDNSCAKPGGTRISLARTRLLLFELAD